MDTTPVSQSKKRLLLVVEDDPTLRDLYVQVLQSAGYEVEQAADGQEAYDLVMQKDYDLILLDIILPRIDGLTMITKLKDTPRANLLKKVVVVTNLGQEHIIAKATELNVRGYMVKTDYTPQKMVQEVKDYIDGVT